jgi:hypothetical protein
MRTRVAAFYLAGMLALGTEAEEALPSAAFREAIARTEAKLLASAPAQSPEGRRAAAAYLAGLIDQAWTLASEDALRFEPIFYGSGTLGGRPGLFNPDNVYLTTLLDPAGRYRITGQRGTHAQLILQLLDDPSVVALGQSRGVIDVSALGVAAGEDFELFLGGEQRGGRWFALAPDANSLLVRMTFADWARETPSTLRIERLDTPPPHAEDPAHGRLARAAQFLDGASALWLDVFIQRLEASVPVNGVTELRPTRDGLAGQYSVNGRFDLAEDEALVIEVARSSATYQAIQLGDAWFVTPDWTRHQVSLNHAQARADADGRLRFVIARRDPGVLNWLDTAGNARGYLFMRWQGVAAPLGPEHAPTARLVKLANLRAVLPADTPRTSAEERAAQLSARRHAPSRK